MLRELRVENLLLIERAELRLAPGLNVLTGETGAGKTMLAHALDLLLGGRARAGVVRPGAEEAYVEGCFDCPEPLREQLGERLAGDAQEIVLARRVSSEGRTRAYLNGRSVTVADLREIAGPLLAFYGQHEHRRLTLAGAQLQVLDGLCGEAQAERLAGCAEALGRARVAQARLEQLRELEGARERELDLLAFELSEIDALELREGEHERLLAERERLRSLDALLAAAGAGAEALAPDSGDGGAAELLAVAVARARGGGGRGRPPGRARAAAARQRDRGARARGRAALLLRGRGRRGWRGRGLARRGGRAPAGDRAADAKARR